MDNDVDLSKFPSWAPRFLEELETHGVITYAAKAVGVYPSHVFRYRAQNPDFAKLCQEAIDGPGTDRLEAAARYRAVDGVEEPVVHQGQFTPIYERDETGAVRVQVVKSRVWSEGKWTTVEETIPVQARNPDGSPKWLCKRVYSDSLLSLLLKGRRKAVFADRTEITGADGGPVTVIDETARAARLAHLIELAKARREAEDLA